MGWGINTHRGTLDLYSKRRLDIIYLLEIPDSQRRISINNLERLIGKLCFMHLSVPGAIGHFYAMQVNLTRN